MLTPNVDMSLPKGKNMECVFVFLQGEVEHKARTISTDSMLYPYQWNGKGSVNEQASARQKLVDAKKNAYLAYLKYLADFEKKFPSGYLMFKKTEWHFEKVIDQDLGVYMKCLQIDGIPSEF